jgi:hypothetical protein
MYSVLRQIFRMSDAQIINVQISDISYRILSYGHYLNLCRFQEDLKELKAHMILAEQFGLLLIFWYGFLTLNVFIYMPFHYCFMFIFLADFGYPIVLA